ncbi:MAG: alanine--glyoxylate aminotransferase family protein [Elusimicrobiota bacterium]
MIKKRLFTPGPTEVPHAVLLEMARPTIHHRKSEFAEIFKEVIANLNRIFLSTGEIFVLSASGTGAMEAAVQNFTCEGDRALTIDSGKFGERWTSLCKKAGVEAEVLSYEWGKAALPSDIEKKLAADSSIKAVFTTLVETSTGTLHPIEEIAKVVSKTDAVLVVDAVSALGSDRIKVDQWGVDVVVSGSQKALMTPPGIALMCVNKKARSVYEKNTRNTYYWNLKSASKSLSKGQTPYTPAVNMLMGLLEALRMINREVIENVWARHEQLAEAARAGIKAMGLELYSESPANGLTAVKIPDPDRIGSAFVKHLEERHGIYFAGGQDQVKGKIFRIAHMGYYDKMDVIIALASVEMTLKELGVGDVLGKGVKAAMEVFSAR